MPKDILLGNVMPAELSPVATGNPKVDQAIRKLQAWPKNPHVPVPRPTGARYESTVRTAEQADRKKLVALLDDAAITTGRSRWSDKHFSSLGAKDRKEFRAHYHRVEDAIAVRKAYLHWLIGAVCNTPAGLDRALEIVSSGTTHARLVAADTLWSNLEKPAAKRRFVDAVDVAAWNGKSADLERVYRAGVGVLAKLDPAAAFNRWNGLLRPAARKQPGGKNRAEALLYGVVASDSPDPRWTAVVLPLLKTSLDLLALMMLSKLPPDPIAFEPLCSYLPKPTSKKGYWNRSAVTELSRIADKRALPWLVGALRASWMNWPAAFEGFRRAGDPEMAHVIREWLKDNDAPDRRKVGRAVIAELEKAGKAPQPRAPALAKDPEPPPARPVLHYKKVPAFTKPKLESRAKLTKVYQKAFDAAGLGDYFERIAQPALWMIPKRVDEKRHPLGVTKLGGHPDLPAMTPWPRVKREPLTFLGQIALADVAPLLPKGALPKTGLLSFFMGTRDCDGNAGYCEQARVILTPARAKLVRRDVPDDFFADIYQAATVKLYPFLSLPYPSNRALTGILKGAKLERYQEDVFVESHPLPQLLGYRTHGWDGGEPATSQLLLQLPGDEQTEMQFGDLDVLGLYIRQKKLAAGDFSKLWPRLGD